MIMLTLFPIIVFHFQKNIIFQRKKISQGSRFKKSLRQGTNMHKCWMLWKSKGFDHDIKYNVNSSLYKI